MVTHSEYSQSFKYEIYDLNGRQIKIGSSYVGKKITLNYVNNGIYIIILKFGNRSESHTIIKS